MFECTKGVIYKVKNDLKKTCTVTNTIAQIFFILMYVYSIITNVQNLFRLIIYCAFLAISVAYFIFFFFAVLVKSQIISQKMTKKAKLVSKYCKLLVQAVAIGLSLYEIIVYGATDLTIIIKTVTIISFAVQILLEIARIVITSYCDLFTVAFETDVKPFLDMYDKYIHFSTKEFVAAAIDKPLGYIAKKLDKKQDEQSTDDEEANVHKDSKKDKLDHKVFELKESFCKKKEEADKVKKQAILDEKERRATEKKEAVKQHLNAIAQELKDRSIERKNKKQEIKEAKQKERLAKKEQKEQEKLAKREQPLLLNEGSKEEENVKKDEDENN